MSALVCGKRTAFDDLTSPGASPPSSQKRQRYRSGGSPSRYFSGPGSQLQADSGGWLPPGSSSDKLTILRGLFPSMNTEELQRALAECGHDLDLTIKGLNLLCLASTSESGREMDRVQAHTGSRSHGSPENRTSVGSGNAGCATGVNESRSAPAADQAAAEINAHVAAAQGPAPGAPAPHQQQDGGGGSGGHVAQEGVGSGGEREVGLGVEALGDVLSVEWVDAVVQEMMSARDLDDARQRAARALQSFGAAVLEKASARKGHEAQQLKEQVAALQRENQILKRAVAIQHERHMAHESREVEVNNLKQMLGQYQEQLRKLEVNNYALNLHLQKAQVDSSLPGRFHPDVF